MDEKFFLKKVEVTRFIGRLGIVGQYKSRVVFQEFQVSF